MWGGRVEEWLPQGTKAKQYRVITEMKQIDAFLPPGDPIDQANEMWKGGKPLRRCDGEREMFSQGPCICAQDYGDDWHLQDAYSVCRTYTRLNVFIPELDLGLVRVETKGYHAACELTAAVDFIKAALDRSVGDIIAPIWLGLDYRERAERQFQVITVGLRGASMLELVTGQLPTLEGDPSRQLTSGPTEERMALPSGAQDNEVDEADEAEEIEEIEEIEEVNWISEINECSTLPELKEIRSRIVSSGAKLDQLTKDAFNAKSRALKTAAQRTAPKPEPEPDEQEPEYDDSGSGIQEQLNVPVSNPVKEIAKHLNENGEPTQSAEELWTMIMTEAGKLGWKRSDVVENYTNRMNHDPRGAEAKSYLVFLGLMRAGEFG
jgi:hypothetical protein